MKGGEGRIRGRQRISQQGHERALSVWLSREPKEMKDKFAINDSHTEKACASPLQDIAAQISPSNDKTSNSN